MCARSISPSRNRPQSKPRPLRISLMKLPSTLFAVFVCLAACTFAQAPKAPNPTLDPIQDTPGLPRVLLIGDSISMGYTAPVRELLKAKANVHRIPQNGGPTRL